MSSQTADLAEALAELTSMMLSTAGVEELLEHLAKLAAERVAPAAACGITLQQDHQPATVACIGPIAAYVDEIQYGRDEGPCLQSMRTGDTVLVGDLVDERRWGSYPGDALAAGVRASLSLPLVVDGEPRGALNLYALQPDAFGPDDLDRADLLATQASAALTVAVRHAQQVQLTEQLREALVQRAVIDQALGILMAEQGCDPDTAFAILREASQHQNRKLRDVAAEIVESVAGGATGPTPFSDPA
ncbi:MAG: GAF and ANTAR domain-containing protein [Nocardioidaceae bacterium]